MMQISREHDIELDQAYERLVAELSPAPMQGALVEAAGALVLRLRSRLIDLATIKAEYEPEYALRLKQAKTLLDAGAPIPQELRWEFDGKV